MKVLLLSEDKSILEENSPGQKRIVEYSSMLDMLFTIITTKSKKESEAKHLTEKIWLYQPKEKFLIMRVLDILKLVSFQIKSKGIFQANIIVCEDQFISTLIGYLLARKYKRPLYINISENNYLYYFVKKRFIKSKILLKILSRADYIKADNEIIREALLKKNPKLKIEIIKPFIDIKSLITEYKIKNEGDKVELSVLKDKFNKQRMLAVTFVNSLDDVKNSLSILSRVNSYFPQISLVIIYSEDLRGEQVISYIPKNLAEFVYVDKLNNNFINYLMNSNFFWGISSGKKYEEIIIRACAIGIAIIAKKDNFSTKFIENEITGFLCPAEYNQQMLDYLVDRTLYLIRNPNIGMSFKINIALSFKQRFGNTNAKEEYLKILQSSWEGCILNFKKSNAKIYY